MRRKTPAGLRRTGDNLLQIKDKTAWDWFDVPNSKGGGEVQQKTLKHQMYPARMLYKRCGSCPVLRSSGSSLLTITKSSNPIWVSKFKHQSVPSIKKRTLKPSHLGYHLLLWGKIQTTSAFALDFNILVQAVGLVLCNRLATLQFNIDLALA